MTASLGVRPTMAYVHGSLTVTQFLYPTLGNAAYVLCHGPSLQAVAIDVPRDTEEIDEFLDNGTLTLVAALDTHIHNDFVTGRVRLEGGHGLQGPGKAVVLGDFTITSLSTPGHTPGHESYLVSDSSGTPVLLFSGGALMVGTAARPDLLGMQHVHALSARAFETFRSVFAALPDSLPVYPTHQGGSFCGTGSSGATVTTIGEERARNPLFTAANWHEFMALHTHQGEYPDYFTRMADANGTPERLRLTPPPLSRLDAKSLPDPRTSWIVDTRKAAAYNPSHVPGSVNVGIRGSFASWVGWIVPEDADIVLIAESEDDAATAQRELFRIGYDSVSKWCPYAQWAETNDPESTPVATVSTLAQWMTDLEPLTVVDVRLTREWIAGHLPGAVHLLPGEIASVLSWSGPDTRTVVHCQSGYRASLAASLLKRAGATNVHHMSENVAAWKDAGLSLVVEP